MPSSSQKKQYIHKKLETLLHWKSVCVPKIVESWSEQAEMPKTDFAEICTPNVQVYHKKPKTKKQTHTLQTI